jgi:alanyl-tRNA synthetase
VRAHRRHRRGGQGDALQHPFSRWLSFVDYFREEAISWAWELITTSQSDGGLGLDPSRLWVTVYQDDEDAVRLWRRTAGLPESRIQRLGTADNGP